MRNILRRKRSRIRSQKEKNNKDNDDNNKNNKLPPIQLQLRDDIDSALFQQQDKEQSLDLLHKQSKKQTVRAMNRKCARDTFHGVLT